MSDRRAFSSHAFVKSQRDHTQQHKLAPVCTRNVHVTGYQNAFYEPRRSK